MKKFMTARKRRELREARSLLAALGWDHRELAKRAGLSRGTVSNILTGQHREWPAHAKINAAIGWDVFTKPSPA